MPISGLSAAGRGTGMDRRTLDLIATVIEHGEGPGEPGPGHPPAETVRVLATLRRFGREGTPWRSLKATPTQASGSTLRRRLAGWAAINLLHRVHAVEADPGLLAGCGDEGRNGSGGRKDNGSVHRGAPRGGKTRSCKLIRRSL